MNNDDNGLIKAERLLGAFYKWYQLRDWKEQFQSHPEIHQAFGQMLRCVYHDGEEPSPIMLSLIVSPHFQAVLNAIFCLGQFVEATSYAKSTPLPKFLTDMEDKL